MKQFAEWLSTTFLSVFIQNHNSWAIPTIQSIHIVGIGMVLGSVLMIDLRILGWAAMDQTLRQTTDRFGPWLTGALWLMLATGILMVIGEPVRELITFSFWLKMFLVAVGALIAIVFLRAVRKHEQHWEEVVASAQDAAASSPARENAAAAFRCARLQRKLRAIRWMAVVTFLIWACIIILGRLIAYDHVWGSWSPAEKA